MVAGAKVWDGTQWVAAVGNSSGGGPSGDCSELGGGFAIENSASSQVTTNETSHSVTLPSGIASGERLLIFFAFDGSPTVTAPSGWTVVTQAASSGNAGIAVLERIATGSEGASVAVTTSALEKSESWAIRLSGVHASTASEGSSVGLSASTSPQPPSHALAGWSGEALWLLVLSRDQSAGAADVQRLPVPFSHRHMQTDSATDTAGLYVCSWVGTVATMTTNPFTIVNEQSAIATIAVRPA